MRTTESWRNWSGTVTDLTPTAVPGSLAELSEVVREATSNGQRVRAAGSGHSFSAVAACDGIRISLAGLSSPKISVDGTSVTVPAGLTLRELNTMLDTRGLALPNLGDIDAQTLAGALQTGTHGTGARYGCLATFVSGMTLVTGDGSVIKCSRTERPDLLAAAAVGLGGFGVVTSVTLDCVPAFTLRATDRPDDLAEVLASADELIEQHDHFEFYWFPYTNRVQVKLNDRVPASDTPLPRWRGWLDDEFLSNTMYGVGCRLARSAPGFGRPLMRVSARALAPRTYTAPSHRVFCTPRRVRFVEQEYGLPRAALPAIFERLPKLVEELPFRVAFPVEVRFTAADDLWLSHGYGRDSVYVAVHQFVGMPYEPYFQQVEQLCLELGGRPHWGKMHSAPPQRLRAAYPRWADWAAAREQLDPAGTFRSPFLDGLLS